MIVVTLFMLDRTILSKDLDFKNPFSQIHKNKIEDFFSVLRR